LVSTTYLYNVVSVYVWIFKPTPLSSKYHQTRNNLQGVLSTVNSIYDPLGFVAQVVIQGKLLLKELISVTKDWNDPLPSKHESKWSAWRDSLHYLKDFRVPKSYATLSLKDSIRTLGETHILRCVRESYSCSSLS